MKQYQISRAYKTIGKMINMQLPVRTALDIYMMSKKMEDACNFALDQERKLIEKHGGVFMDDGSVDFGTTENADGFRKEIAELNELDIELDIKPVEIQCSSFEEQTLSPFDIACLDGFIRFV